MNTTRAHAHDRQHSEGTTAEALALPFDDGIDEAVPFLLTAAAHREVLGREVPALVAVPEPTAPADDARGEDGSPIEMASDTRRAQARALLRSGMPVATIAAALGTDVAEVEGWTSDLVDELARRRRRAARRQGAAPARRSVPDQAPVPGRGREDLLPGLAFGLAAVDGDVVTLLHDRIGPVAVLLDAMRARLDLPAGRIRVAVRLAPDLAADRERAGLAQRLGVDPATIIVGRAGPDALRAVELRVDVRDAAAARLVRSWRGEDVAAVEVAGGEGLRGWDSNPQTFRLTADCSAS